MPIKRSILFKEPSDDPNDYPLNKFQFEAFVIALGSSIPEIEAIIDQLPITDFAKAVAKSRLRNAGEYNRGHEMVGIIQPFLRIEGKPITNKQIDDAWMLAKDLK